ncbi:MAG: calcium/sodium antiporter [Kofleriaceae bacterium]|nr:calcium/sodium antiporter [Kofleriaceae bacterium]
MLTNVAYLVGGLVLLYFGAEWLVGAASRIAVSLGIRPLVIGLTVVAFGTSSPELVVGIGAAASGQGGIALGNAIGSNIANIGIILAITALIHPPAIDRSLRRREVPVLLGAVALVPLVLLDGVVQWWDGAGLLGIAVVYTWWMVRSARGTPAATGAPAEAAVMAEAAATAGLAPTVPAASARTSSRGRDIGLVVLGLALLVVGGRIFVDGAIGVARAFGMSERVIGLTVVAIGTSLPELATSVIAALRGHSAIAVGNVVGSNIFNVLLILGASGLVAPLHAELSDLTVDLVALSGMTVAAALVILTRARVSRAEGVLLLAGYVAFVLALL